MRSCAEDAKPCFQHGRRPASRLLFLRVNANTMRDTQRLPVGEDIARALLFASGWTKGFPRDIEKAVKRGLLRVERAGKRLARLGWPMPMSLTPREMYVLVKQHKGRAAVDRALLAVYESDGGRYFERVVANLSGRKHLKRWQPLLEQALTAYRRGDYAITVPALLTVVEGVLMRAHGNQTRPIKVVTERIAQLEATFGGSVTVMLWRVVGEFVRELYARSDFTGRRPRGLNRHWILHGRDVADWDRSESLRLFQAVDTLSYLLEPRPSIPSARSGSSRSRHRRPVRIASAAP